MNSNFDDNYVYRGEQEYRSETSDPKPLTECRTCDNQGRLPVYYMRNNDLKCGVVLCDCAWGDWHSRRCGTMRPKRLSHLSRDMAPKGLPYTEYIQLMLQRRLDICLELQKQIPKEDDFDESQLSLPEDTDSIGVGDAERVQGSTPVRREDS